MGRTFWVLWLGLACSEAQKAAVLEASAVRLASRFCGDKDGQFPACPDADAKQKAVKPAAKPAAKPEPEAKPAKLELGSDSSPCASCLHSKTLPCFYDESCPGVGCGAQGHKNCRFCGGEQFPACPDPNAPKAKPASGTLVQSHGRGSGSAHWDLELAVEVRQCQWDLELAVEVWQCPLQPGAGEEAADVTAAGDAALIKSSGPHLAGTPATPAQQPAAPAVTSSGASGDPQMTDDVLEEAQDRDVVNPGVDLTPDLPIFG
eukprot:s958_g16.t1